MYRALLLNNNHEVLSFITERRSIKFILSDAVDVLSAWDDSFVCYDRIINFPAVIRLKYFIKRPKPKLAFSRDAVFKRDDFLCQYCGKSYFGKMTMDHVIPKTMGGDKRSFVNCVTACYICNNKKGGRTPEQAGMKLMKVPVTPTIMITRRIENVMLWHDDWKYYVNC